VSLYQVVEHWRVHQCPAHPGPHPWQITRRVVQVFESRPCLAPVELAATDLPTGGRVTVKASCGRRRPVADRCGNCRPVVEVIRIALHVISLPGTSGERST
jgi:hypothetical protein